MLKLNQGIMNWNLCEYTIKFVSHKKIKEHIACYRINCEGKEIYPPAALKLGIPTGEIWISDAFKEFAEYILYHELREIEYRAKGYEGDKAHELALRDEEIKFKGDEKWERFKREINICTVDALLSVPGIGRILAERIINNRPYDTMEELLKVKGIGEKKFEYLKNRFWCIVESKN